MPSVGGAIGIQRIRNRTTLLARMQVGEFFAIIGLIKRTRRIYGRLFTVSGVIFAFRKTALHQVSFWSNRMMIPDNAAPDTEAATVAAGRGLAPDLSRTMRRHRSYGYGWR